MQVILSKKSKKRLVKEKTCSPKGLMASRRVTSRPYFYTSPETRKKTSIRTSKLNFIRWKDPEFRKKMSKVGKNKWKNLNFRKFMLTVRQKNWKNPEYRKKMSGVHKKLWKNTKHRKLMQIVLSNSAKKQWRNPIYRKNRLLVMSKITKNQWNNPVKREKILSGILNRICESPNKFELRVQKFLDNTYPYKFKYCGDGSVLINGKSPDFINQKKKIIILAQGVYYHLTIKGLTINDKNKRKRERIEARPFVRAGYRVIFIWEDELNEMFKKEILLRTGRKAQK